MPSASTNEPSRSQDVGKTRTPYRLRESRLIAANDQVVGGGWAGWVAGELHPARTSSVDPGSDGAHVFQAEQRAQLAQAFLEDGPVAVGEVQLIQDLHADEPVQPDPALHYDVQCLGREPVAEGGGVLAQLLARRLVEVVRYGEGPRPL